MSNRRIRPELDFRLDEELWFPDDCARLQRVLAEVGLVVTLPEAQAVWTKFSDRYCASWLSLPSDDETLCDLLTEFTD